MNDKRTFLSPDVKRFFDATKCSLNVNCIMNPKDYAESFINKWGYRRLDFLCFTSELCIKENYEFWIKNFNSLFNDTSLIQSTDGYDVFSLSWTKMETHLRRAVNHLVSSNKSLHYLALLQITSVTEHILRNVFKIKGRTVPFLLKDLIETKELEEILSLEMVCFIRFLLGSVHSFNLRNIAWHGFIGIEDVYREHSSVLLFVLHECGRTFHEKNLILPSPSRVGLQTHENFGKNLVNFDEISEVDAFEIITQSSLVSEIMQPHWKEVLSLIMKRDNDVLLLLLPLLENSLRILYARVNKCPSRILTATDSTFYITMDEILSPWIQLNLTEDHSSHYKVSSSASNQENDLYFNLVPQYLGRQLTEALYDFFHYVSGPRLRDKISHGEIFPQEVSFNIIQNLFKLSLLILSSEKWRFSDDCLKFTIKCSCEHVEEKPEQCSHHYPSVTESFLKQINSWKYSPINVGNLNLLSNLTNYSSLCHPASLLRYSIKEVLIFMKGWLTWEYPIGELQSSWHENAVLEINYCWNTSVASYDVKSLSVIEEVINIVIATQVMSLFSSKIELEVIRTLQRIMNSIKETLINIKTSLNTRFPQYQAKLLRSRQREIYLKHLVIVPDMIFHIFIVIQMVYFIYSINNCWRYINGTHYELLKIMLRKVLKVGENLVTYTAVSVNNYHAAYLKLSENTNIINKHFQAKLM